MNSSWLGASGNRRAYMNRFVWCCIRIVTLPFVLVTKAVAAVGKFNWWPLGVITALVLSPVWISYGAVFVAIVAMIELTRFFHRQAVFVRSTNEQRKELERLQMEISWCQPSRPGYSFPATEQAVEKAVDRCIIVGIAHNDLRHFVPLRWKQIQQRLEA